MVTGRRDGPLRYHEVDVGDDDLVDRRPGVEQGNAITDDHAAPGGLEQQGLALSAFIGHVLLFGTHRARLKEFPGGPTIATEDHRRTPTAISVERTPLVPAAPAHRRAGNVPEPRVVAQNGQAALRPSSSTFMTVNVASAKPPIVYRPRSTDGSADGELELVG
jgi:hypothetical protein